MSQTASLTIARRFTEPNTKGYDNIKWTKKDAIIANPMTKKECLSNNVT
jgi:hypothetical protein